MILAGMGWPDEAGLHGGWAQTRKGGRREWRAVKRVIQLLDFVGGVCLGDGSSV